MTDVDSLLSELIEKIKADEFFADITVGKSYGAGAGYKGGKYNSFCGYLCAVEHARI